MKTIKVKELEVPMGAMPEVVDILIENNLGNSLNGTDEDDEVVFLKVSYDGFKSKAADHWFDMPRKADFENNSYLTKHVNEVLTPICSAEKAFSSSKEKLAPVFGSQSI